MADTPDALVAEFMDNFAHAEQAIEKVRKNLAEMSPKLAEANLQHGIIGALLTGALQGEVESLAGDAGALKQAIFIYHRKLTDIAAEKGIDGAIIESGGGR